jgi:AraC family transcriptional regulator of adaptative response/methylated-DNA-[protein]-cysteine methyltransferase
MSTDDAERSPRRLTGRGGGGRRIGFTLVSSAIGRLLVAGTEAGLCAVYLGDAERDLEASFRSDFFAAELRRDDATLKAWARRVRALAEGEGQAEELPLDLSGTPFQRRVWAELRRIPRGQVRTYAQVAAAVGTPKASRSVGHACASNPVALVVPCHRVIRSDGGLGAYRWGMARKKRLLGIERTELDWS